MQDGAYFVLDIGTRSVRGLVCERIPDQNSSEVEKSGMRIVDCETREHKSRAMLAGQIHDIEKVSAIIREIKGVLESRIFADNRPEQRVFTKVAVAVAGRNLLTCRGSAEFPRAGLEPVAREEIRQAELMAVQSALENISEGAEYYCVGYSGIGYRLDGEELTNLTGHRGFSIGVDVLVTLLPRNVLDAMFEVTRRAGLEIDYLTLEPIAALEASVTESMKPLSLVLVDIGAGTSDIAIVSRGKIRAYGMLPLAGDAFTENICGEYIVDFNTGERIKREAGSSVKKPESVIEFNDIFNRNHAKQSHEILEKLRPAASGMAHRLSEEILKLSGENLSEYAVLLVGGGSRSPYIESELSLALSIPAGRIGTRPVTLNDKIEDATGKSGGPDSATAAGIGLMSARRAGLSLTHLTVNEKRMTMVSSEKNPTVLSVLLSNGVNIRQIYGRPGLAKTFTLNGEFRSIKGEPPRPATAEINGKKVSLDSLVREGDKLVFYPAVDGKEADGKITDLLPLPAVKFNGKEVKLPVKITVNGKEAPPDASLDDRSDIRCSFSAELKTLLAHMNINPELHIQKEIHVDADGDYRSLKSSCCKLSVNGQAVDMSRDVMLKDGYEIELETIEPGWKVADVVSPPPHGRDLKIRINGEEYVFPGGRGKVLKNGSETGMDALLSDGDIIRTVAGKDAEAVLVDVFKYISVNPGDQFGRRIKLLIDGQESQYTSPLHDNAEVKVFFE